MTLKPKYKVKVQLCASSYVILKTKQDHKQSRERPRRVCFGRTHFGLHQNPEVYRRRPAQMSRVRESKDAVLDGEEARRPRHARRVRNRVQSGDPEKHRHRETVHRRAGNLGGRRKNCRRLRGGGVGLQAGDRPAEEAAGRSAAAPGQTGATRSEEFTQTRFSEFSSYAGFYGGTEKLGPKSGFRIRAPLR